MAFAMKNPELEGIIKVDELIINDNLKDALNQKKFNLVMSLISQSIKRELDEATLPAPLIWRAAQPRDLGRRPILASQP